jgi:flagellar P-ring protein FlgI
MKVPFPTSPVYALGQGVVDLPDSSSPTAGVVRGGARMLRDVAGPEVPDIFELIIDPHFSGWAAASQIATAINSRAQPQGPSVAVAVDERTIRVSIPEAERGDRAAFLADVMGAEVNSSLLDLPAQVIVNSRTGAIVVTGDVEISPVAITHKDLNITTTRPTPVPSAQNPLIERQRWADVRTSSKPSENAKLADLLTAFKSLDIPVTEQIAILQMLHKTGKLQARLVVD